MHAGGEESHNYVRFDGKQPAGLRHIIYDLLLREKRAVSEI